tara:strand:+ start:1386 stop:2102 length:717 start_codon:yes stop_codon:yes gene_type:complete
MNHYIYIFVLIISFFTLMDVSLAEDSTDGQLLSPTVLVVDLDGDGVELIPLNQSEMYFDIDGDGLAERTAWVNPDDGILRVGHLLQDRNPSIVMENIRNSTLDVLNRVYEADINKNGIYDPDDLWVTAVKKVDDNLTFAISKRGDVLNFNKDNLIKCDLEYFSYDKSTDYILFQKKENINLKCKGQPAFTSIEEVRLPYEDTNIQWVNFCNTLKKWKYDHMTYTRYCGMYSEINDATR